MNWSPDTTQVKSWNEWDTLRHVIVGRADDCHIPPEEPALDAKVPEAGEFKFVWDDDDGSVYEEKKEIAIG